MSVDIKAVLRKHIAKKYKSQTAAAAAWGCAQSNVSQILAGKHEPSEVMLKDVGYKLGKVQRHYVKV